MPFDIEGARKSGYSDDEIIGHLAQSRNYDLEGAKKSGYSNEEILSYLSQKPEKIPIRDQMRQQREEYQKQFFPAKEDVLKYGGAAVGALAGGVPGGILGYGIGEEVSKLGQPRTTGQAFSEAGGALKAGAEQELGGPILAKGIQTIGKGISKIAPRIYESVLKAPPGTVPIEAREKAVSAALESGIAPTKSGLSKLRTEIDDLNKSIESIIDSYSKQGQRINMADVIKRTDELKASYANLPPGRASKFLDDITDIESQYMTKPEMTIKEAQQMKQKIYQLHRKHYGELKSAEIEAEKQIARGLKEEIVSQVPQVASLNEKDSARVTLENLVERAVKRSRNWDILGLTDLVGGSIGAGIGTVQGRDWRTGGEGAALGLMVTRSLREPAIAARLAFAISKAKTIKGVGLARPIAYQTFKEEQQ